MGFYWIKTSTIIKKIFSNYVWDIPNAENKIYLTFDDGPIPEITEWVLEELQKHNAKATFFCIGHNIEKYPDIFKKIIHNGHSVGNHTFNHLNGWKTSTKNYIENSLQWSVVRQQFAVCRTQIEEYKMATENCQLKTENYNLQTTICSLFRPPYGKIKKSQSKKLRQQGYKIIMWDVLSADYDSSVIPEKCLENVLKNTKSGSIIVFHDSKKAFANLKYTLPKALQYWTEKGFVFEKIV